MRESAPERRGPIRLVAFDMDGVLIDHISSWAAVHEALGTRNRQAVSDFADGLIDDREFILRDVALWRAARPHFSRDEMRAILARVPRMAGMVEAVASLRSQEARCVIISGGLRPLAEMLVEEAGFEGAHSNDVVFGPDGRLAEDAVVDVPLRSKGAVLEAVQARFGVSPTQTAAIGDSHFDVGLFARSRLSVAFNPSDEHVEARATHVVRARDLREGVAPILESMTSRR